MGPVGYSKLVKPLMRYYGGKWNIAKWVIDHMPPHRNYVEPFGGAASVLLRKEPSLFEIYNDIDSDIVNLFEVLRDKQKYEDLKHALKFTPFSRVEFNRAFVETVDNVESARRLLVRTWMGFNSRSAFHHKTNFRTNYTTRSSHAKSWQRFISHLDDVIDRLKHVVVECVSAEKLICETDDNETLFYLDPPYPHSTRWEKVYRHEMSDDQHRELAGILSAVKGMVLISGYPCDLYDIELYPDWKRVQRKTYTNRSERTEVLWMSPNAMRAFESAKKAKLENDKIVLPLDLLLEGGSHG